MNIFSHLTIANRNIVLLFVVLVIINELAANNIELTRNRFLTCNCLHDKNNRISNIILIMNIDPINTHVLLYKKIGNDFFVLY